MSEMGKAMMGTGEASGEGRAVAAAEAAIANPLIDDVSLKGAKGLIINITGGNDITLYEVDEAANRIKQEVDEDANIIYGTTCDERLEGLVRVSIVATGIDVSSSASPKPLEVISTLSIDNSVYLAKNKLNESVNKDIEEINLQENLNLTSNNIIAEEIVPNELSVSSQESNLNIEENTDPIKSFDSKLSESEDHENSESEDHENSESEDHENSESEDHENSESEDHETAEINKQEEIQPSVRRLSLFDTLENHEINNLPSASVSSQKSEPVFEKNIENNHNTDFNEEILDDEFSLEESNSNEEFNQEVEEELLDIPTFLRRQAN
jgi:cell division protein FtsZ